MKLSIYPFAFLNSAIAYASGNPRLHEPRAVRCALVTPLIPKLLLPTAQAFCSDLLKYFAFNGHLTKHGPAGRHCHRLDPSRSNVSSIVNRDNSIHAEVGFSAVSTETLTFTDYIDAAAVARAAPTKPAQWAAFAGRELSSACSCIVSAARTTITLLQTSTMKTTHTVQSISGHHGPRWAGADGIAGTITVSSVAMATATKIVTITVRCLSHKKPRRRNVD
ncbi:hypothetical protein IG631_00133 [Alternaria alternata]|nr:hypothetical protein IG631_00133 [Alternaria alternata]